MFRLFRRDREKGASAVEFAIVAPLLVLLVFGIIEAGWFFAQQVEVRHGAREGARTAAVSDPATSALIRQTACDRMAMSNGTASVTLTANGSDIGDTGTITVVSNYAPLTGFIPFGGTIQTTVDFRLEQPRSWSPTGAENC